MSLDQLSQKTSQQCSISVSPSKYLMKKDTISQSRCSSGIKYGFNPCTATASMLLYAQGATVVCAHHDTLAIERRFSSHLEDIQILVADTISDRGAGKWVISYDTSQIVIIWDCLTGDELTRFESREALTAAAWMRNGTLAFGNVKGEILLFETTTRAFISTKTMNYTTITALAPGVDCKTFAIGFSNGSLVIATLEPTFTVVHNLSSTKIPLSPITNLAWHASSSRQKSYMLAAQFRNDQIRIWSITKSSQEQNVAKVVRVLQRTENPKLDRPNWLSWSKNGRIIQFSEKLTNLHSEIWSWDVRTKNVTYERVPILDNVRGLAIYSFGATLFTLGPNDTVQQFDLNSPPQMVANVQHPDNYSNHSISSSSPLPFSSEKIKPQQKEKSISSLTKFNTLAMKLNAQESDDEIQMSPLARIVRNKNRRAEYEKKQRTRNATYSPVSSRSQTSIVSQSSTRFHQRLKSFEASSENSTGTKFHVGSPWNSSREPSVGSSHDNISISSTSSRSDTSAIFKSPRYRHHHEIISSDDSELSADIFINTRKRLESLVYPSSQKSGTDCLSNHDCSRQMLRILFDWEGEVQELIQFEMESHPLRSTTRLLLARWLGKIDTDSINSMSKFMCSSDWMLLALSTMGNHESQIKVSRVFVQRLLEAGDVHTAATIMIGMGDLDDAIEAYASHKKYMEAIILTCHVFPDDWSRQAQFLQQWGELAVKSGQRQLAARCFICTGLELSGCWYSSLQTNHQVMPDILSPPLSPPKTCGPLRNISRTLALKLNTSFDEQTENSETSTYPAGSPTAYDKVQTAFLRPSQRSAYHTPASARTATPNGFKRQNLPLISDNLSEVFPDKGAVPEILIPVNEVGTETEIVNQSSDASASGEILKYDVSAQALEDEKDKNTRKECRNTLLSDKLNQNESASVVERAATTSPMIERPRNPSKTPVPLSSPESLFSISRRRATQSTDISRHFKPEEHEIQWPPLESIITGDYITSSNSSVDSSRRGTSNGLLKNSLFTAPPVEPYKEYSLKKNYESCPSCSPVSIELTCSNLDDFIYSLESAQKRRVNENVRPGHVKSKPQKSKFFEVSEKPRSHRTQHFDSVNASSNYPSLQYYEASYDHETVNNVDDNQKRNFLTKNSVRDVKRSELASFLGESVVASSEEESVPRSKRKISARRVASFNQLRQPSYDHEFDFIRKNRGRNKNRGASVIRSPSSPIWSTHNDFEFDEECNHKLHFTRQDYMHSRSHSQINNQYCVPKSRDSSEDENHVIPSDKKSQNQCISRMPREQNGYSKRSSINEKLKPFKRDFLHRRTLSDANIGDSKVAISKYISRKEKAARELEERRKSLVQRPSAPPIIHPQDLSTLSLSHTRTPPLSEVMSASKELKQKLIDAQACGANSLIRYEEDEKKQKKYKAVQLGLPATPKAMKISKFESTEKKSLVVPRSFGVHDTTQPFSADGLKFMSHLKEDERSLSTLPSTTYKAINTTPIRRLPQRSASAPILEEPPKSPKTLPSDLPTHPAFQVSLPPSCGRRILDSGATCASHWSSRKVSPGESYPGTLGYEMRNNQKGHTRIIPSIMSGIIETIESSSPPSPTIAAPPLLKELQHLALPPPPPPPPVPPPAPHCRPEKAITSSIISGISSGSGIIEILHDYQDDLYHNQQHEEIPIDEAEYSSGLSSSYHNRVRSESDFFVNDRSGRVTGRLCNVSRGQVTIHHPHHDGQNISESKVASWIPSREFKTPPSGHLIEINSSSENPTSETLNRVPIDLEGGMI